MPLNFKCIFFPLSDRTLLVVLVQVNEYLFQMLFCDDA